MKLSKIILALVFAATTAVTSFSYAYADDYAECKEAFFEWCTL